MRAPLPLQAVNVFKMVDELSDLVKSTAGADDATAQTVVDAYVLAAETMLDNDLADNIAIGEAGADDILSKVSSKCMSAVHISLTCV
eukprot:SAG31_NODE_20635_length_569_cov_0.712766_1_plen_87_part_00